MIKASLTLRRYISYYGPWCSWSYIFPFRLSLVASKSFYTALSLGAVRADDPAKRTWHQCFRAVIRARSWAHCLSEFDLVQISWIISVQSLLPHGNSCSSFLTLFWFFLRPIGRITVKFRRCLRLRKPSGGTFPIDEYIFWLVTVKT